MFPSKIHITLLFLLFFVSCSNEIEVGTSPLPIEEYPVPIRISSEWIDANTKSKVDKFTDENVGNIGIFGTDGTNVLYKGISPNQIISEQLIFKTTPLVYPANGSSVNLSGFYPKVSCNNDQYSIDESGLLHFILTGKEDLMYAPEVAAGSKTNPNANINLQFDHKLTSISFKLINAVINPIDSPKETISIVTNAPNKGTLDLRTGELKADAETFEYTLETTVKLSDLNEITSKELKGELMLLPASAYSEALNYSFQLAIGEKRYAVTINDIGTKWEACKSYELTITIKGLTPLTKTSTIPNYQLTGTVCELNK